MRICVPRREADIYFGIDTEGIRTRTYLARVHGLNGKHANGRNNSPMARRESRRVGDAKVAQAVIPVGSEMPSACLGTNLGRI
jgi:hypothetical protein